MKGRVVPGSNSPSARTARGGSHREAGLEADATDAVGAAEAACGDGTAEVAPRPWAFRSVRIADESEIQYPGERWQRSTTEAAMDSVSRDPNPILGRSLAVALIVALDWGTASRPFRVVSARN